MGFCCDERGIGPFSPLATSPWGDDHDLQVSGNKFFPEQRWREAILFYLNGIWSDNQIVTYRPKIMFGGVTLRLDFDAGEYFAYGETPGVNLPMQFLHLPEVESRRRAEQKLFVRTPTQAEVEVALVRFVKDNRIKLLTIKFEHGHINLWKMSKRSQYRCAAYNIPRSWGLEGPIW